MKINWGTAIVLAFIGFISFILFFVIRMNTDHRANHDLVREDYYKAELNYQNEIDAENRAKLKGKKLLILKKTKGLQIEFPTGINHQNITGKVSLYRPSNKNLDFDFNISLSNAHLLIPDNRLLDGRWDIKISWKIGDDEYLHKERITY